MPLSFGIMPDPIKFLQKTNINPPRNKTVARFLREIAEVTSQLEAKNLDTGRFLTVFQVKLQSVKKVSSADIVFPIAGAANGDEATVIERPVDPNVCQPLPRRKIMKDIGDVIGEVKFSNNVFEAIAWKYIKPKPFLWWQSDVGGIKQYSNEVPSIIRKLSRDEILSAIDEFKKFKRERLREIRAKKG